MRDLHVRHYTSLRRGPRMDARFWRGVLRAALLIGAFVAVGMVARAAIVIGRCSDHDPVYARGWR